MCAALENALSEGAGGMARRPVVRGYWQEAARAAGGPELKPVGAAVYVSVSPPAFETPGVPEATFECSIEAVFENASAAAARSTVVPVCGAILRMLGGWTSGETLDDIAFEGFSPHAATMTGGEAPRFDEAAGEWTVSFTFRVDAVARAGG